jgi:acetyl esterase/lipase
MRLDFTNGILLLLLIARTVTAQTASPAPSAVASPSTVVEVWPDGKMPGHGAVDPEKEITPIRPNLQRITNISHPTLTFFPAPKKNSPAPTMIVCPGGAYKLLSYNREGTEIAAWLNSAGINALILKYRVPDNQEGALQDLQRALSLVRAHAAEWGVDPKRLGVIGFSAGGNLCAKASTQFGEWTYQAIDSVDQQSCRPDFVLLIYPAYLEKQGKVAPDLNLKAKIPPTLIVQTEDDTRFVLGSELYDAALDEAKVPHDFKLYPTGGHGYGLHSTKDVRAWPEHALQWLHKIGFQ